MKRSRTTKPPSSHSSSDDESSPENHSKESDPDNSDDSSSSHEPTPFRHALEIPQFLEATKNLINPTSRYIASVNQHGDKIVQIIYTDVTNNNSFHVIYTNFAKFNITTATLTEFVTITASILKVQPILTLRDAENFSESSKLFSLPIMHWSIHVFHMLRATRWFSSRPTTESPIDPIGNDILLREAFKKIPEFHAILTNNELVPNTQFRRINTFNPAIFDTTHQQRIHTIIRQWADNEAAKQFMTDIITVVFTLGRALWDRRNAADITALERNANVILESANLYLRLFCNPSYSYKAYKGKLDINSSIKRDLGEGCFTFGAILSTVNNLKNLFTDPLNKTLPFDAFSFTFDYELAENSTEQRYTDAILTRLKSGQIYTTERPLNGWAGNISIPTTFQRTFPQNDTSFSPFRTAFLHMLKKPAEPATKTYKGLNHIARFNKKLETFYNKNDI